MKSTEYSEKVIDHFKNPRNVGSLEGENVAVGRVGNPVCGDLMEISIKVEENIIQDIKFKTFGCGSAVATSSMVTEMVKGMTLDDALKVTRKDVADQLDGLPPVKMHCSNLAADALHEAIRVYRTERGIDVGDMPATHSVAMKENVEIVGEKEYIGKGVFYELPPKEVLQNKRILVYYKNNDSIHDALKLTEFTGRVILLTPYKEISAPPELLTKLFRSDVKVVYLSQLLEISGEGEVEKVKIQNLDEDEKYELFVDAILLPAPKCE
jgi:nitrogen fixation NifU-like protein